MMGISKPKTIKSGMAKNFKRFGDDFHLSFLNSETVRVRVLFICTYDYEEHIFHVY